jgi:hypothetical protein
MHRDKAAVVEHHQLSVAAKALDRALKLVDENP